jgi:zinc finger protein 362/384
LQKHIERAEKRASGLTGLGIAAARNSMTNNAAVTIEHPYWPKVSPDSASTTLTENMQQQQQQNQYDFVLSQQQNHNNEHLQGHHRTILEHHQRNSGNISSGNSTNGNGPDDVGEDLVVIRQNPSQHLIVSQTNQQHTPVSSGGTIVVTSSPYNDAVSKATTNSAFTPINVMHQHHHQLAQRPLYYDTIAFQNKNIPQNTTNGFPNQLISLHQIRNYAHQPGGLISGIGMAEHLGIVSAGGKDKQ